MRILLETAPKMQAAQFVTSAVGAAMVMLGEIYSEYAEEAERPPLKTRRANDAPIHTKSTRCLSVRGDYRYRPTRHPGLRPLRTIHEGSHLAVKPCKPHKAVK